MSSNTNYPQLIQQFIRDERLPQSYEEDAQKWFLPLKDRLLNAARSQPGTLQIVGINGAQGTGKSTLAKLLQAWLQADGLSVVNLSIDDFYYSRKTRQNLANEIHPLLKSRGVPGTHDVAFAINTLNTLRTLSAIETLALPQFDKASDEPVATDEWAGVSGPVNLVILEGWFVGARPEDSAALDKPINSLEADEDKSGTWRQYINDQLATEYQTLFSQLNQLILLKAPSFEQVYEWRALQEQKLKEKCKTGVGLMNEAELKRFIQQFERLTRHCLASLPNRADVVLELDSNHRIHRSSLAG
jgi:D-glycerate 3-kinase